MSIFKRTQRKYVKKAYRVRNWREYEAGSTQPREPDRLDLAHRRQACELGRAPAKEEGNRAVNASTRTTPSRRLSPWAWCFICHLGRARDCCGRCSL